MDKDDTNVKKWVDDVFHIMHEIQKSGPAFWEKYKNHKSIGMECQMFIKGYRVASPQEMKDNMLRGAW